MMQLYRRAHPETEVPPTPAAEPPAPEIHAVPEISMPPVAPEVPPEPVPEPVSEPQPMPEMPEPQTEPLPEPMAEQQLPEEPQPLPASEEPFSAAGNGRSTATADAAIRINSTADFKDILWIFKGHHPNCQRSHADAKCHCDGFGYCRRGISTVLYNNHQRERRNRTDSAACSSAEVGAAAK